MSIQDEEQNELIELVEEQSDIIQDMAVTQNALISILMNKGFLTGEELETAREDIIKAISEAD